MTHLVACVDVCAVFDVVEHFVEISSSCRSQKAGTGVRLEQREAMGQCGVWKGQQQVSKESEVIVRAAKVTK